MIKLVINNTEVEMPVGASVLAAVRKAGFDVPAMCWNEELEHINSCMLCLVKDAVSGRLFPSCSAKVQSGMQIITDDDEIGEARKTGLELLLSEHVGDCEAPCAIGCPAHMNIPKMNRLIAAEKFDEALKIVKRDIALPTILGHICPAPCEGVCRRRSVDEPVAICLLKRFAGENPETGWQSAFPLNGKRAAIIGAGPAGLSAAYYLRLRGIKVDIFDKAEKPGGKLRTDISHDILPIQVLEKEIDDLLSIGINFSGNTAVDNEIFERLTKEYNVVVLATGIVGDVKNLISQSGAQATVDKRSYQVGQSNVFAIGNVLRSGRLAVRSVAQGKEAAFSISQFLDNEAVIGEPRMFNSRFGKLSEIEIPEYLQGINEGKRVLPDEKTGFTVSQAMEEASRCMNCDCAAIDDCRLREWSDYYNAQQNRFKQELRKPVKRIYKDHQIVFEPQKCIKCGICVKMTEKYGEALGLTFIGRGFDVEIGIPYNESLEDALRKTAEKVAAACPTGALGNVSGMGTGVTGKSESLL